jgi:hypothetical protein
MQFHQLKSLMESIITNMGYSISLSQSDCSILDRDGSADFCSSIRKTVMSKYTAPAVTTSKIDYHYYENDFNKFITLSLREWIVTFFTIFFLEHFKIYF